MHVGDISRGKMDKSVLKHYRPASRKWLHPEDAAADAWKEAKIHQRYEKPTTSYQVTSSASKMNHNFAFSDPRSTRHHYADDQHSDALQAKQAMVQRQKSNADQLEIQNAMLLQSSVEQEQTYESDHSL